MHEWMNEWTNERMNYWVHEWVSEWVNECMYEWTDEMKWHEMTWNDMKWNDWVNEWRRERKIVCRHVRMRTCTYGRRTVYAHKTLNIQASILTWRHADTHTHTHRHIHMHTYISTCIRTSIHACIRPSMHVCMHVRWSEMIKYDTICSDSVWYGIYIIITCYDMTWYDMVWCEMICFVLPW